ncbi:MAG: DUF1176 domain-containing protein [Alphaproteobacteria bacterium]|nr:DUF1176 domain-containing protein [Alphaproteobacteria bacterium]MBU2378718.1 DUF1176 domain-containing protein [Alphaproteobacteria bacterium]
MRNIGSLAAAMLLAACGNGGADDAGAAKAATPSGGVIQASGEAGDRTFRDWYAVCDNANTCYAFGHATEGTGWVRVSIPAGPDAHPSVVVGVWPQGEIVRPVSARVDGRTFAGTIVADDAADEFPIATIAPADARRLIDAMTQGQAMAIVAGAETVPISLSGAAASMLWIDERQGRLDTTTALMRGGPRPASQVPAAPEIPRVVAAPSVSQAGYGDQEGQTLPASIEALPAAIACRAETAFNPDLQKVISSARLNANTVMWSVPCGAGAYNFANAYFTTDPQGANPRRVVFPTQGEPEDLLVNAAYDPATRVIDAFNKGRGLGDCGYAGRWTWTGRGFAQKSSSGMSECWGVPSEYWPTFRVTAE